jgi:hypothetical protein
VLKELGPDTQVKVTAPAGEVNFTPVYFQIMPFKNFTDTNGPFLLNIAHKIIGKMT